MPKIGHIVLAKDVMKSKESEETILLEPFSVLSTNKFPFNPTFIVSVGVFNLNPGVTYNFAYFFYTPTGKKIDGNFFDIKADPNSDNSVEFTLNINIEEMEFKEEGVHNFRFQISNLHEEKSTFFFIKQKNNMKSTGDKDE